MAVRSPQGRTLIGNVDNMETMAEIGIWKGHMARYIFRNTDKVKNYWSVDPWTLFPPGHGRASRRTMEDWSIMYKRACRDMVYFPGLRVMRLTSERAAPLFPDKYFDLVFIDAMHDYESVKNDISLWLPKVKKGGVLSGHDYETEPPGVKKAVDEIFSNITVDSVSTVWMITV